MQTERVTFLTFPDHKRSRQSAERVMESAAMTVQQRQTVEMMALATLLMLQAAAPARTPAPSWKLAERTNAAGIRSVSASVTGQDGLSRFVVKCDVAAEPIVSVQFIWPSPLGASVAKPVSISFDGGLAIIDDWNFPGSGAYIADADEVTRLTTMLVKAKQVAVSTTNGSNFTVQASFAGPPGDAAIRQVLGACGYTLGIVPPAPFGTAGGEDAMMLGRLNHVGVATPSIAQSVETYRSLLGATVIGEPFDLPAQGVKVCFIDAPNTQIELIEPYDEASPIAGFLRKNPAGGQHHVCFEVPDIHAAVADLTAQGATVLGGPRIGAHGTPIVFVHPKDFGGLLVELMESPTGDH